MGLADTISQALGGSPQRRIGDQYASARAMTAMTDAETQADNDGLRQDLASGAVPENAKEIMRREGLLPDDAPEAKTGGLADTLTKAFSGAVSKPAVSAVPTPTAVRTEQPRPAGIKTPDLNATLSAEPIIGAGEAALSAVTGAIAAPVGAAYGLFKGLTGGKYGTKEGVKMNEAAAAELRDSLTYQPRTDAGKEMLAGVGKLIDESKIAGMGPTEGITLGAISAGNASRAVPAIRPKASEALAPRQFGSVGSAAAATNDRAVAMSANATPEMRAIVDDIVKKKQSVNLEALERHVEADSLPVPVSLTEGQATQDVVKLSHEMNQRGKNTELAKRFDSQNKALLENTNAIRENAAPDVYATSIPEHGEMLIDSYLTKDRRLNAEISAKYKALTDANGGDFPLDAPAFVKSADAALHKELLFDHVPPTIRKTLDRVAADGMTFENFESLRTNLARIQRSVSADGNEKAAAGVIREALENLPMPEGAEHLKPLADAARASAKARFDLLKADPAYKAVVTGKIKADNFVQKHVIGADRKSLETLRANLAEDPTAAQVVASGVVNYLKARAGIVNESGNFSQAGYNKALEGIRPKLEIIFQPEQRKQIEALGNVARYTQAQPRGSFVNNSNTLVGAMAEGAKNAVEGAANVAAKGVPVGTFTRKIMQGRADKKAMQQTLQTGAGIRLKDVK